MTGKNVFKFKSYKDYLLRTEQEKSVLSRGFRSQIAKAVGCNNAFVSQVLNKGAHFSLEQGLRLSRFLKFQADEEKYFLLLIEFERAGTKDLQVYFLDQLNLLRETYLNIKNRVESPTVLSAESQATYYSEWYYAAVHTIVTIPKFRNIAAISTALGLSSHLVRKILSFLVSMDLVSEVNNEFKPGSAYLHLDKSSPNISKHHTNWRIAAVTSLARDFPRDIHYSTVSTMSLDDVEKLRSEMVQFVEDYVNSVKKSKKEEEIYCFNMDFFTLM